MISLLRCILLAVMVVQLFVSEVRTEETRVTESATFTHFDHRTTETPITTEIFGRKLWNKEPVKYTTVPGESQPKPFEVRKTGEKQSPAVFRVQQKESSHLSATIEDLSLEEAAVEVEKYLKSHPELPELSREEIIDYIHNISDSKMLTPEKKESARETGEMPIMVVLPYKPENEYAMEELFTKSPLVRYLEAEVGDKEEDEVRNNFSEPKIITHPVYETSTEEIISSDDRTTNPTLRTYTTYNDAEMVTKKYNFEEPKYESTRLNHKYEESSNERVQGAIVVLPLKNHNYNSETIQIEEEVTTTTTAPANPITTQKTKSHYRKRVKTTTVKPVKTAFNQQDSLENFDFEDLPSTLKPVKVRKWSRRKTTTTSSTQRPPNEEELTKVLEILPPDMKDLLSSLDLNDQRVIADAGKKVEKTAPQPSIDPSSYSAFKRLPAGEDGKLDDEMKGFLASFGLIHEEGMLPRRREKALEKEKDHEFMEEAPNVSLEIIPEDMRHVLHNLGLTKQSRAKDSRNHIFNPSYHTLNQSEEETKKLKDLMMSIKKIVNHNDSEPVSVELQKEIIQQIQDLDNLTLKYKNRQSSQINDEIKQIIITNKNKFNFVPLDNITESSMERKKLVDGPDPLSINEGGLKNEIKRQVSSNSNSTSNSSGSIGSDGNSAGSNNSASHTTTEEAPNTDGLKASFGGGETAPDDADVDSALPPKKPNGLYLLVDWNSFLEVGTEDDKRRVNIRFQPKIGDGRHFIPVSIP